MTQDSKADIEVLIHIDETSFGIYPFPHHAVDVSPLEGEKPVFRESVMRGGNLQNGKLILSKPPFEVDKRDLRVSIHDAGKLYAWFTTAIAHAPLILAENAHGFWLNRFRWKPEFEPIRAEKPSIIDLTKLLGERKPLREDLFHHGESLQSKYWSMLYHRENFERAVNLAKTEESKALHLAHATAEFNAHASTVYGILDETAELLALVHRISTGRDRPRNFHDLYDKRQELEPNLCALFDACDWYEDFRSRRANAAHGFNCMIEQTLDENGLALFQRPHWRFSVSGSSTPKLKENAEGLFAKVAAGVDRFVAGSAAYVLGMSHQFDMATFSYRSPEEKEMEVISVWMRNLRFSSTAETADDAWVMIDSKSNAPVFSARRTSRTA